ncbi:hypothetical protein HYH03_002182 [Edaphochlamys debaryana]|uniref:Phospholipid/glycerol acyltransferase domain-containing protein n=1 Tax=Edaphochlamys debaryana TaxID=47281 RepID=A0A835YLI9_9CHLO|nr:hypothetical protein HYH03_002182 [Edaphochlamys debaryana]|eukprot:KAG2499894.1 hypothetical protein HYH03_002182 [Edaphochlamys debaryana]
MPKLGLQQISVHYKEFLRKTAAYHHQTGGEAPAVAGQSALQTSYVQRAALEASLEQSLARLASITSFEALRERYVQRKQRAKERLRLALDAQRVRLGSYLGSSTPSDVSVAKSSAVAAPAAAAAAPAAVATAAELRNIPAAVSTSGSGSTELEPLIGSDGMLRRTVLYVIGSAARAYMTGLNSTTVEGAGHLAQALERPSDQALITVCNHVAALDDPLVVAAMLPEQTLQQPEKLRWTLCASDRCFRYAALVPLFRAAKVLPVVRGGGLAQPGMAAAEARLAAGDWVHIFPEGTRSRDGVSLGAVRKGVGRLVASLPDDAPPPLVVPFVHRGMEGVMPRGSVLPATGQKIDVLVGDPIPVADLLSAARAEGWPEDQLHTALAGRVSRSLTHLTARLDARRAGLPDPGPLPDEAAAAGREGATVSSLDQFDPADLLVAAELKQQRRGAVAAAWERVKFRMQHRSWAASGGLGLGTLGLGTGSANPSGSAAGGASMACAAPSLEVSPALSRHLMESGTGPVLSGQASGSVEVGGVSPYLRQLLSLANQPRLTWAAAAQRQAAASAASSEPMLRPEGA